MTTDNDLRELLLDACELLMIATFYTPAHQSQRTDVCNRLMDAMTPKPEPDAMEMTTDQELLQQALTDLSHARIFVTTREKMHPAGIELYDECIDALRARIAQPRCDHHWSDATKTLSPRPFCFKCGTLQKETT